MYILVVEIIQWFSFNDFLYNFIRFSLIQIVEPSKGRALPGRALDAVP